MPKQNGLKKAGQEMWAEVKRMGEQGRMELANALFNGSAFVPYGEGQRPAEAELDNTTKDKELERENEGRDM